jgi:hypothetical protein
MSDIEFLLKAMGTVFSEEVSRHGIEPSAQDHAGLLKRQERLSGMRLLAVGTIRDSVAAGDG